MAALLLGAVMFFSCKSAPEPVAVDPLLLIDRDAALYLYIPVQAHLPLMTATLVQMTGMSEKDAERIASRTETVYIAEESTKKRQIFQVSAKCSIPLKYAKMALKPENGWIPQVADGLSIPYTYYTNPQTKIELCLPSSQNALISYAVQPQLSQYDTASALKMETLTGAAPEKKTEMPSGFDKKVYDFLTAGNASEIRFYERKADSFLQNMLGTDLKLPLKSVSGTLANAKNTDSEYDAKLILEVNDATPAKMKSLVAGLKIALFPMPAKIQQLGADHIAISDISLSKTALVRLVTN